MQPADMTWRAGNRCSLLCGKSPKNGMAAKEKEEKESILFFNPRLAEDFVTIDSNRRAVGPRRCAFFWALGRHARTGACRATPTLQRLAQRLLRQINVGLPELSTSCFRLAANAGLRRHAGMHDRGSGIEAAFYTFKRGKGAARFMFGRL